jgi:NAD/NADP transhydrogenase beta subunit
MVRQSMFRMSRQGKLTGLMIWVALAGGDLYVVVSRLHSLSVTHWIIAALWFLNAAIWIRLMVHSLKVAEDE